MDTGPQARANAAVNLIREEGGDPALILALVVWPITSLEHAAPTPRNVSAEEVERMILLEAEGLNHRQIGEQVGRPRSTVSAALQKVRQPV
jgi:hypothetical protein